MAVFVQGLPKKRGVVLRFAFCLVCRRLRAVPKRPLSARPSAPCISRRAAALRTRSPYISLLRRLASTRAFRVRPFASCAPPYLICLLPCACLRSRFKFLLDTREWLLSPTAARGKCDTLSPLFCLCKARQRTVPFARSRWHGTWPHNRKVGGSPWQLPLPNMYETSCL